MCYGEIVLHVGAHVKEITISWNCVSFLISVLLRWVTALGQVEESRFKRRQKSLYEELLKEQPLGISHVQTEKQQSI